MPLALLLGALQIHPIAYRQECVVSDSEIASRVGAEVMRDGGNAIDAAIATGFALAVTFPAAGNIGGGGFMVVRMADGKSAALDFRETAPKAATRNMYLDASGKVTKDSLIGYRAAGIPGTPMGFWEAHKKFGKLPWKRLLEPAVKLARDGFAVDRGLAASLRSEADQFKAFPASWKQFCRDGKFYEWGDRLKQGDLAATLARIRDGGADGFYRGKTADLVADDMAKNQGLMTREDLAAYDAEWRAPSTGTYRGYDIVTMPPPSSGGVCMLQMLGILEGYELQPLGWNSSEYLHLLVESMKRSFADRSEAMGDPGFVKVPVTQLLSPEYIKDRRATIDPNKATPAAQVKPGVEPAREGEHTTHYSVVDAHGNGVSVTYTINTGFGSRAVVNGAGFLLNNEMDDFAALPGKPNGYGLVQGEANAIQPGKRPLSSMTPTIVSKNGKLTLVLGSPGGPTIINTVLQTVLNVTDFGMTIQEAVAAPRIHHQWLPDEIRYEPRGLAADTKAALEKKGHIFAARGARMGSCHAIAIDPAGNRLAGIDPRVSSSGSAGR